MIILNSNQSLKILILSPFIYPEPISTGKYNTVLATTFAECGAEVEVIALHPLYPDWKSKKTSATLSGINIIRGGGDFLYPRSIVLRRIQLELIYTLFIMKNLIAKSKSWDIVLPVFPPSLLFFVINFLLPKSIKKVGIVHDLQGVMARVSKNPLQSIMIKFIRILEKWSLKSCDKLIFVSQSMRNRALGDYRIDSQKTIYCYPFVSLDKSINSNVLDDKFIKGKKHIVYSGALGEKQDPLILVEVFNQLLKKRQDVCCHIFSRGPWFNRLKSDFTKNKKKVFFHDLVDEENLYELYVRSNVQIVPQKSGTGDGAIPSKLPNIISAGVPIFSISDPESELSKIVQESMIGNNCNSWDIDEIVQQLSDFIDRSCKVTHKDREQLVNNYVIKNFNINNLIEGIVK